MSVAKLEHHFVFTYSESSSSLYHNTFQLGVGIVHHEFWFGDMLCCLLWSKKSSLFFEGCKFRVFILRCSRLCSCCHCYFSILCMFWKNNSCILVCVCEGGFFWGEGLVVVEEGRSLGGGSICLEGEKPFCFLWQRIFAHSLCVKKIVQASAAHQVGLISFWIEGRKKLEIH